MISPTPPSCTFAMMHVTSDAAKSRWGVGEDHLPHIFSFTITPRQPPLDAADGEVAAEGRTRGRERSRLGRTPAYGELSSPWARWTSVTVTVVEAGGRAGGRPCWPVELPISATSRGAGRGGCGREPRHRRRRRYGRPEARRSGGEAHEGRAIRGSRGCEMTRQDRRRAP
jgi:hypothetical protein